MNWKTEAEDKLKKYELMRLSVRSIPQEIERLELSAQSIRGASTDKTPVKGGGSRREEFLLNNLVLKNELKCRLRQSRIWVRTVSEALETLNPEEQLILQRLYIVPEKGAMDRLCAEFNCEKSQIYRIREKSLEKFTLALYGATET